MNLKREKMKAIEYIGKEVTVKIDRPIGSSHPKYPDHIYLVNYGYVPNTTSEIKLLTDFQEMYYESVILR